MFNKILIANRGEIAVRIVKACRELGIISAAIYSDADKYSLHVKSADEAYYIGAPAPSESYLNIYKIIKLAKSIGADAIHPGYGFLSENPSFIQRVEDTGIIFIGPSSKSVSLMGDKTSARRLMRENKVPIVPGTVEPVISPDAAKNIAKKIGYPVLIKATAGGGGKGMRKISDSDQMEDLFNRAKNEALKSFGNPALYLEKFIEEPKHIEVQILGDKFGNYVHLYERECSIQRRHQKIIEEAPSPFVDDQTRADITSAAVKAAKACNYYNAGTIEFLMDKNKKFYFLEMNTRLQVEHPVTEMITGFDLVKEQIKVANGEKLSFNQKDISMKGHALECRVYAENVDNNFAPSIGRIIHHRLPSGPGVRIDRGIDLLSEVSVYYDPMLSKIITLGSSREEAISRMKRAIGEYQIAGVISNLHACKWILNHKKFLDGSFNINFIEEEFLPLIPDQWKKEDEYIDVVSVVAALLKHRENELKPVNIECKPNNNWRSQLDE